MFGALKIKQWVGSIFEGVQKGIENRIVSEHREEDCVVTYNSCANSGISKVCLSWGVLLGVLSLEKRKLTRTMMQQDRWGKNISLMEMTDHLRVRSPLAASHSTQYSTRNNNSGK